MGPRFLAVDFYLEAYQRAEKKRLSLSIPVAPAPASSLPGEQPSQCPLSASVARDSLNAAVGRLDKLVLEPLRTGPLTRELTTTLVSSFLPERKCDAVVRHGTLELRMEEAAGMRLADDPAETSRHQPVCFQEAPIFMERPLGGKVESTMGRVLAECESRMDAPSAHLQCIYKTSGDLFLVAPVAFAAPTAHLDASQWLPWVLEDSERVLRHPRVRALELHVMAGKGGWDQKPPPPEGACRLASLATLIASEVEQRLRIKRAASSEFYGGLQTLEAISMDVYGRFLWPRASLEEVPWQPQQVVGSGLVVELSTVGAKAGVPTIETGVFLLRSDNPSVMAFREIGRDQRLLADAASVTKTLPACSSFISGVLPDLMAGQLVPPLVGRSIQFLPVPILEQLPHQAPILQSTVAHLLAGASADKVVTVAEGLPRPPVCQALQQLLARMQAEEKLAAISSVTGIVLEPHHFQPYESFLSCLLPPRASCHRGHSPAGASGACVGEDSGRKGEHHLSVFQSWKGSPGTAVSALRQPQRRRPASPGVPRKLCESLEGVCESNHPVLPRGHTKQGEGSGSQGPGFPAQDTLADARRAQRGGPVPLPEQEQPSPSEIVLNRGANEMDRQPSQPADVIPEVIHQVAISSPQRAILQSIELDFGGARRQLTPAVQDSIPLSALDPRCSEALQRQMASLDRDQTADSMRRCGSALKALHTCGFLCLEFGITVALLFLKERLRRSLVDSEAVARTVAALEHYHSSVEGGLVADHPKQAALVAAVKGLQGAGVSMSKPIAVVAEPLAALAIRKLLTDLGLKPYQLDCKGVWPDGDKNAADNLDDLEALISEASSFSKCLLLAPRYLVPKLRAKGLGGVIFWSESSFRACQWKPTMPCHRLELQRGQQGPVPQVSQVSQDQGNEGLGQPQPLEDPPLSPAEEQSSGARAGLAVVVNTSRRCGFLSRKSFDNRLLHQTGVRVVERDCQAPADLFVDARTAAVVLRQESLAPAGSVLEGLQHWVAQDLTKLSLCVETCALILEGEEAFTLAAVEAMDFLHGAAAALDTRLQCFFSPSPEGTQDILLATIELQLESGSLVPGVPEDQTPAEAFLCRFASVHPLSACAILSCRIPLPVFMGLLEDKQEAAAAPHGVVAKCLALFRKQCYQDLRGVSEAESGGSAATSPIYYGRQTAPVHAAGRQMHPGALLSPEEQAGPPGLGMPIVSPFPPLCGDEELLSSEAPAEPLGFDQAEAPHDPGFPAYFPADDSPPGPPQFPGPESTSAAGALDRWLAEKRLAKKRGSSEAAAPEHRGAMGFLPVLGMPRAHATRAGASAMGMSDVLGLAGAGGMAWEDGCAGSAGVGARQELWDEGETTMRDTMQPPPASRRRLSTSSTRSGSLQRSSSTSFDAFRHTGVTTLRGGRRRIAQETRDLRALRGAPRPAPTVSRAALPSSPPPLKEHRGRIVTPADHIARDVLGFTSASNSGQSTLLWRKR